jgi:hypothetical protein
VSNDDTGGRISLCPGSALPVLLAAKAVTSGAAVGGVGNGSPLRKAGTAGAGIAFGADAGAKLGRAGDRSALANSVLVNSLLANSLLVRPALPSSTSPGSAQRLAETAEDANTHPANSATRAARLNPMLKCCMLHQPHNANTPPQLVAQLDRQINNR